MTVNQLINTVPYDVFQDWVIKYFLTDPEMGIDEWYDTKALIKAVNKAKNYNELFEALDHVTQASVLAESYGEDLYWANAYLYDNSNQVNLEF